MEPPALPQAPLLAACPFCDYSLEGLPIRHACPECGREFDRRWRLFGNLPAWRYASLWSRLLRGALYAFALLVYIPFGVRPASHDYVNLLLACLITAWVAWDVWVQLRRPRWFVTVGQDGVSVCRRGERRWEQYPLDEISKVELARYGSIWLRINGKEYPVGVSISRREVQRCAEYINLLIDGGAERRQDQSSQ